MRVERIKQASRPVARNRADTIIPLESTSPPMSTRPS